MSKRPPFPTGLYAVVVAASAAGCTLVMDLDFDGYHAVEQPGADGGGAGGAAGAAGVGGDAGMAGTAGGEPDASSCELRLVLNEIQTSGLAGADDEFVELYNAGVCPADLTGVRLAYRSSSATVDHSVTWYADEGVTVPPGGMYVVGGATFSMTPDSRLPPGFALGATGGGLAIRRGGDVLDQAGWGDATNGFVNQLAAAAPAPGKSIARHPDGSDANDDWNDLTEGSPTPGEPNGAP